MYLERGNMIIRIQTELRILHSFYIGLFIANERHSHYPKIIGYRGKVTIFWASNTKISLT